MARPPSERSRPQAGPDVGRPAHAFSLVLEGASELTPEIADALYEAGCDDALIGSRDGVLFAEFDREAPSSAEAILSAIRQVESAGIGLRVMRVEPDELVSAAEVADRVRLSRETIRLYAMGRRGPGGFPPPVARIRGRSPLYRWTDVAPWLARHVGPAASRARAELDAAILIGLLNAALDLRRLVPRAAEDPALRGALGEIDLLVADRRRRLLVAECKMGEPETAGPSPGRSRRTRR